MSTLKVELRGSLSVHGALLELAQEIKGRPKAEGEAERSLSEGELELVSLWRNDGCEVPVTLLGFPDEELDEHQLLISLGAVSVVLDIAVLKRALKAFGDQ